MLPVMYAEIVRWSSSRSSDTVLQVLSVSCSRLIHLIIINFVLIIYTRDSHRLQKFIFGPCIDYSIQKPLKGHS